MRKRTGEFDFSRTKEASKMSINEQKKKQDCFPGRRLIDALRHQGAVTPRGVFGLPGAKGVKAKSDHIMRYLSEAQVFEITNVSDYYYSHTDQEEWDLFQDFPCVMPPFDCVWFEYKGPRVILSKEFGRQEQIGPLPTLGVLVCSMPAPDNEIVKNGTIQTVMVFYRPGGSETIFGAETTAAYFVDQAGVPTSHMANKVIYMGHTDAMGHAVQDLQYLQSAFTFAHPALLAMTFLNCKNTQVIQRSPDQKLSRIDVKKGRPPLVTFRTLEIEQVKQLVGYKQGQAGGLKKALHVARGHFKDYRERGLFGRTKGLFWWGPAIRGTSSAGTVIKDYSIGGPLTSLAIKAGSK